ncbi:MAG: hypothetical protein LUG99_00410 [Lachnospiraceae bacterium]|nr:hypothetical protein [Lachnospiraceae bacterium]
MATKLKNLKVTKVDFVDEGANPDAHIPLFKRKDEAAEQPTITEPEADGKESIWKRLFGNLFKSAGMEPDEVDNMIGKIEKSGAETFGEKMNRRRSQKIVDEIWDICYALHDSLCSIMWDEEIDGTQTETSMNESVEEFYSTIKGCISTWADGKTMNIKKNSDGDLSEAELEVAKMANKRLTETIEKATSSQEPETSETNNNQKGEESEMKIDKSKMTPAEKAILEEIEKRYGVDDGTATEGIASNPAPAAPAELEPPAAMAPETAVEKALQTLGLNNQTSVKEPEAGTEDDIYKGLNPALKAEIEELRKFRELTEEKELHEVAKRYEIIGKKEEELYPVLKSMKAAGGTAYDDLVKILDETKATVEKSGVFSEIGKSGGHTSAEDANGESWAIAETRAAEIMKSKNVTKAQALDEVFIADPALAKKCDEEG